MQRPTVSSRRHSPVDLSPATGDPEWERILKTDAQVHFVDIGEHRLRVIEIGTGEPVLLVHGFADSAYTWHRNLRALAGAGFRVLAHDHPGYGQSGLPSGARFGVDDLARLAVGLLDAFGIARTHLVGHSMGVSRCSLLSAVGQRLAGPWLTWPALRSVYRDSAPLTPQVLAQYRSAFWRPEYRCAQRPRC
jgi:pimeloyl-ACP methyl ester carboxylesterase